MERGFESVRSRRVVPKDVFMSLYTFGNRCAREDNKCDRLSQHHRDTITRYLRDQSLPALESKHGDALLDEFRRRWDQHKVRGLAAGQSVLKRRL